MTLTDLERVLLGLAELPDTVRELRAELGVLRRVVEEQAEAPRFAPTADAARAAGFPSPAALRMAANRNAAISAARVDRRRWDVRALLAAVESRGNGRKLRAVAGGRP